MNIIIKAAQFAEEAHRGQTRKYTNKPYIEHPARVAARLSTHRYTSEELVAAAWLHDVLEDCNVTLEQLTETFGPKTANIVYEVTNLSKRYPELDRAARKAIDRDHIAGGSRDAKMLKLVDRADNMLDMTGADDGFKRLYADESWLLQRRALCEVDYQLEQEYRSAYLDLIYSLPTSIDENIT